MFLGVWLRFEIAGCVTGRYATCGSLFSACFRPPHTGILPPDLIESSQRKREHTGRVGLPTQSECTVRAAAILLTIITTSQHGVTADEGVVCHRRLKAVIAAIPIEMTVIVCCHPLSVVSTLGLHVHRTGNNACLSSSYL